MTNVRILQMPGVEVPRFRAAKCNARLLAFSQCQDTGYFRSAFYAQLITISIYIFRLIFQFVRFDWCGNNFCGRFGGDDFLRS